jgi:hypothetical protein
MRRISFLMLILFTCLVSAQWVRAQDSIITFDAPGAGTGAGQGTQAIDLSPAGSIVGYYADASGVFHGFLRAPGGAFTTIDAPGAGTGASQGTFAYSLNQPGAITGFYVDASNVAHGFLLARNGTFTSFDAPGAGIGAGQGTVAGNINPVGTIAGYYIDASSVEHGFVRAPDGTVTSFDAPGAGTGAGQGTFTAIAIGINQAGAISGAYSDSSFVIHSYVRAADGTITTFDAPGAGTGAFQGTNNSGLNPAGATMGVYHCRHIAARSRNRTQRVRYISSSGVSQKPK